MGEMCMYPLQRLVNATDGYMRPMNEHDPIPPVSERTSTLLDGEVPVIPATPETPRLDLTREEATRPRNPLDDITPEKPKSHPIAYAALAIATLALLLSLLGLRGGGDGDYREVKVGNADCVIGPQQAADGTDVLFCRTGAVPGT
ncbi:MAG: hypothetical protein Q8K63_08690 [Acidimicrobiales bacterium]|nr:hypothetical protein [Acidimicrobiales bacterium]